MSDDRLEVALMDIVFLETRILELEEKLAKREKEPLSDAEISFGRDGYDDRFVDGVLFAEKHHNIGEQE